MNAGLIVVGALAVLLVALLVYSGPMNRLLRLIDEFADDDEQAAAIIRFLAPYRPDERSSLLIDLVNQTLPRLGRIAGLDVERVVEIRQRLYETGMSHKAAHVEAVLITAGIKTQTGNTQEAPAP